MIHSPQQIPLILGGSAPATPSSSCKSPLAAASFISRPSQLTSLANSNLILECIAADISVQHFCLLTIICVYKLFGGLFKHIFSRSTFFQAMCHVVPKVLQNLLRARILGRKGKTELRTQSFCSHWNIIS